MKKFNEEQLDLIYKMFATGCDRIQVCTKLDIKIKDFQEIYDSDISLQVLVENALNEYDLNSKREQRSAKAEHEVSKNFLVQAIVNKINDNDYSIKDVEIAWRLMFPEDDYQRYKSNMEIEMSRLKLELEEKKLAGLNSFQEYIEDSMIKQLEDSIDNE